MAEEEQEAPEGGAKRGANGLLLVVMLVNTLALVGGGVYFAFFHQGASAAAPAEPEPEPNEVGPLLAVDPIVANLSDETASRFVKVGLQLELVDEETRPVVEGSLVPIRNEILLHLSGLTSEDIAGSDNKQKIRGELLKKVQETLGTEDVRRIFFTEFVVQ